MGQIRDEPVMGVDQGTELVGFPEREGVVPPAAAAGQVDVLSLIRLVVLGTGFEVRMLQDAHLFQQGQRPIDRRIVRAIWAGEIWPWVRITSETIARRWGVMRNPCSRSRVMTEAKSLGARSTDGECSSSLQVQREDLQVPHGGRPDRDRGR